MAQPWFRLYTEVLTDRKIDKICKVTNQPRSIILGAWVTILCLANDSPERGALLIARGCPVTDLDLVDQTGLGKDTFEAILEQLKALCMIVQEDGVYHVTNWDKRQFTSDVSTERVRKHRATKANDEPGTLPERYGNAPETEAETETDTEHLAAPASTRKKPREPKPEKETCPREWMTAILKLCGADNAKASPGLRKRVSQCGIVLIKDGQTLDDLNRFSVWWYTNDWRGKRGDPPTPELIRDTWEKQNGKQKYATTNNRPSIEYSPSDLAAAAEVTRRNRERLSAASVGAAVPAV